MKHRYKFSKTTRQRMSEAHKGKKMSAETKLKISQARLEREQLIAEGWIKPFRHTAKTKRLLRRIALDRHAAKRKKGAKRKTKSV